MALSYAGGLDTRVIYTSAPSWNNYTFSYNHPVGVDGFIMIAITMANTSSFSATGVTYGGQQMTMLFNQHFSGQAQRQAVYGLVNPPTGSNTISVTYASQQFNPSSVMVRSFHGCDGFGNYGISGAVNSPNAKTLTVSGGSVIYATAISTFTLNKFEIDNSNRGIAFQHNVNRQVGGAFSLFGLTAGSVDVTSYSISSSYTLTNVRVEIKEKAGAPPTGNNANFLQFL